MSEASSVCAQRYAKMVLLPGQVEVLTTKSKRVYLYGPPGSGKTLLLLLKAREWLREGHHVILLNIRPDTTMGYPYAYGVERRLRAMVPNGNFQRVDIDAFEFQTEKLAGIMPSSRVIIDEVTPASLEIIEHLCNLPVQGLWCAGLFKDDEPVTAHGFQSFPMDQILRCPPIVQSLLKHTEHDVRPLQPYRDIYAVTSLEAQNPAALANAGTAVNQSSSSVKQSTKGSQEKSQKDSENGELKYDPDSLNKRLMKYGKQKDEPKIEPVVDHFDKERRLALTAFYNASSAKVGLSTDGPRPHIIDHGKHSRPGLPMDCLQCGQELAEFLFTMVKTVEKGQEVQPSRNLSKNKFYFRSANMRNRVMSPSSSPQPQSSSPTLSEKGKSSLRAEPLINSRALSWSDVLIVSSEVSLNYPLIASLRNRNIPVEVVKGKATKRIEDPTEKKLFVTQYKEVTGLERALIVFVPSHGPETEDKVELGVEPWPDLHLGRSISRFDSLDRQALWYIASRSLSSLVLLLP